MAENCVEIATKLYLPLGSNCRTLVEVNRDLKIGVYGGPLTAKCKL